MTGLTLGVLVLITVMSVMNGFDRELRQRVLGMVPHAVIKSYEPMRNWEQVAEKSAVNRVFLGCALIQAQGW